MKVEIVRIGNSRGIRLPKPVIEQCGFSKTVDLRVEDGRVVIEAEHKPRQGWREAFRRAGSAVNDEFPLDNLTGNQFDREEWNW